MSKLKKIALIVALVMMMSAVAVIAVACGNGADEGSKLTYVELKDMVIPEHVNTESLFGLFFLDREGNLGSVTGDLTEINFDPTKPTLIYIHGMQAMNGYKDCEPVIGFEKWLDAGYNFGLWRWAQFSDCDIPNIGTELIWTRNYGTFYYEDENGKRVKEREDVLKYSTAECFVAYWMDFMSRVDYTGSQIIFSGHSLGANTLFAVSDYMFLLNESGSVGREYLPDRLVFLDAYVDGLGNKDVPWLSDEEDKELDNGGIVLRTKVVAEKARKLGITAEYVKSSFYSNASDMPIFGTKGLASTMLDSYTRLDLDTDGIPDINVRHNSAVYWFIASIGLGEIKDASDVSGNSLGFGATTPISVSYARNLTLYKHGANKTYFDYTDDTQASVTEITAPKIAGFAFNDINDNGINDDRLYNRVGGIKVSLYENNVKIAETVTDSGGYYEFVINGDYSGKNYKIEVELDGWQFGKVSDGGYMNNGIDNGRSLEWTPASQMDLKIINIGVKK